MTRALTFLIMKNKGFEKMKEFSFIFEKKGLLRPFVFYPMLTDYFKSKSCQKLGTNPLSSFRILWRALG